MILKKVNGKVQLTPKQKRFVIEYLVDRDITRAALTAGYSPKCAEQIGSHNLNKPIIRQEIDRQIALQEKRLLVKSDEVIIELKKIGFSDINQIFDDKGNLKSIEDMPEGVRRCISSVEVEEEYTGKGGTKEFSSYTKKIKLWDKLRALELLGKNLKMFGDNNDGNSNQVIINLIIEEAGVADKRQNAAECETVPCPQSS